MTKKWNVLVVDDEAIERQSLVDILRLEGYNVSSVSNGPAALDFIRMNAVDLILLDLRMPGMSGLEVIKVICQQFNDIEIILLTAHGSLESAISALRHRVHDYLLKPASPTHIIESVARGLERRRLRIEKAGLKQNEEGESMAIRLENDIVIQFDRRVILQGDIKISLTPAEGRLLKVLVENPGKVFSHRELVLLVQGYTTTQLEAPEILRPLVSRLRQKLTPIPSLHKKVVSVRGTGYLYAGKTL